MFEVIIKINIEKFQRKSADIILKYCILLQSIIFFQSCANQLPPPGGEEDKMPPKIINVIPKSGTVNFKGNSIEIEFDEYVDRRSFEESLFISPRPKGGIEFNWSGKKVEIEFIEKLEKNKTYTFTIGKELKDLRGGNAITAPIKFALSTGSVLDKNKISGKVFASNSDKLFILAYILDENKNIEIDPQKSKPDFITQVNENGFYTFENLRPAVYRLYALKDNDRNLLYDRDFDKISVTWTDVNTKDTTEISGINFILGFYMPDLTDSQFISNLENSDTLNYISASIRNYDRNIPPESRILLLFKNNKRKREEIAVGLKLTDTLSLKSYKLIYNWFSDSLLEVRPLEELPQGNVFKFTIDFRKSVFPYYNEFVFRTTLQKSLGSLSGRILKRYTIPSEIYVHLFNKSNPLISYQSVAANDSNYIFKQVPEGKYRLFSFIDFNDDGSYDYGSFLPFRKCEKFFILEPEPEIKGGWNIDNVFIRF